VALVVHTKPPWQHGGHETHEKNAGHVPQIYDIYGHLWLFKNGKTDFPKLFGIVIPFDVFSQESSIT